MLENDTPLFDKFMSTIEDTGGAQDFLDHIGEFCFSSELCHKQSDGERLPKPMPLARKLEDLFTIALKQRRKMANANGWDPSDFKTRTASQEEMQQMTNTWRHDVEDWMHPKNLDIFYTRYDRHDFTKNRFNTFQFHISGCKFLLSSLIQLPIIAQLDDSRSGPGSAAQPAEAVRSLLNAYEEHKGTKMYRTAVDASKRNSERSVRLSRQIWKLTRKVAQGNRIRRKLDNGELDDDDLDAAQQELWNYLEENEDALQKLRKEQLPVYRGAWAYIPLC